MSRPRRSISKDGYLICTKCRVIKHIREFYTVKAGSVWFVLEDPKTEECEVFGKPTSWCKECMNAYQKARREDPLPPVVTDYHKGSSVSDEDLAAMVMPRSPVPEHETPETP